MGSAGLGSSKLDPRMAASKDIRSTLGYWDPYFESDKRPWTFTRPREEGEMERYPNISSELEVIESTIHDGRQHDLNLDQNGFQRINSVTSLGPGDFLDEDKLKNVYFKEVEAEMRRVTGAEDVIVWNHFIRNDAAISGLAQDHNRSTLGYSRAIHCDTHPYSAERVKDNFIQATGRTDLLNKRFVYLTAWRNINTSPVQDNHLALLDERSLVKPDDIIVRDNFSIDAVAGKYKILQYVLWKKNASKHFWYYFPDLTRDEMILHKQFDSDTTKQGRMVFHTSVPDPTAPANIPPRASVEVRAFCFFSNEGSNKEG